MTTTKPVALVTGASSGIGEVFARKLSQQGYRLLLVARRKERLDKLAAELKDAESLPADLSDDGDVSAVEARIAAEPQLEFLVNNAGFGVWGKFYEADPEAQNRMHRVHILAIERLTHAALKGMMERSKGNIINVSSVAGFINTPNNVGYCATKAWINSFTEGLFLELKCIHSPVRVQSLCPGFTYSEFHDVLGMDRGLISSSLWLAAEHVVDDSLRALERNKLFVIPGWRYKLLVGFLSCIPRPLKRAIAIKYGDARMKTRNRKSA